MAETNDVIRRNGKRELDGMKRKSIVFFTERNIHGAIVVYGIGGVKQYYGYTKKQAIEKYKQDNFVYINEK